MRAYKNGTIRHGQGSFDEWAVLVNVSGIPSWPKDVWYFSKLMVYKYHLGEVVYEDFCSLYNQVTKDEDQRVFDWISDITAKYPKPDEAEVVFGILYMTMISEENKAGAILKKRIKRLGVHQVLKEGMRPDIAAEYSKGKKAQELTMECHSRGF
jgi:hypothetical protein